MDGSLLNPWRSADRLLRYRWVANHISRSPCTRATAVALTILLAASCSGPEPTAYTKICDAAADLTEDLVRSDALSDPDDFRDTVHAHDLRGLVADEDITEDFGAPALGVLLALEAEAQGMEWMRPMLDSIDQLNVECERL